MTDAVAPPPAKKRGRPSVTDRAAAAGISLDEDLVERRGGARANAGRKSAALEAGAADAHIIRAKAAAQKEVYQAKLTELDYKVKSGEYLPREEIRTASATAFSMIAQAMRSIPDNLERRLGVSPAVAEEVSILIDEAMGALADELERLHSGA